MDTSRVDIVYRPLRIAWAIKAGDFDAFRFIAKLSCTLAGGRYNPIVIVDAPEATHLIESFRADVIRPVSDAPEVTALAERFQHLIGPWFGSDDLHFRNNNGSGGCHLLDIDNLLARWHGTPEWQSIADVGMRRYVWDEADPLADVFLVELGTLPSVDEVHVDYADLLANALQPEAFIDVVLPPTLPIPEVVTKHPGVAFMGRFGVRRYPLSGKYGWNNPGFFVGQADELEDLVAFWNLRAADIQLNFIDRRYPERYAATLPIQKSAMSQLVAGRSEFDRQVAVWARGDRTEIQSDEARRIVGDARPLICNLSEHSWNGMNIEPPTMMLGRASTLGVVVEKQSRESVTFALPDKPFSDDTWFYMQKLVASVSMFRSRQDGDNTFQFPYIPELNERLGRSTMVGYAELRVEPDRLGIVVDATSEDATVYAVPTIELVEELFKTVGLKATLSQAGLITRQLITQMGGIDSTRAFKIPGVRRLIRKSGLNKSVKRKEAIELIGAPDPENPAANFKNHARLFIERRPINSELSPGEVFSHLVAKRIFRIGADLDCPSCRLTSWLPLDDLRQNVDCIYCGADIDTTRHFSIEPLTFRRSGLLGIEKNMQGAIPVTMVLQQLMNNIFGGGLRGGAVYMPSLNVDALDGSWPQPRETDFFAVELSPRGSMGRKPCTRIVIGEAKDRGSSIDANDAETMRRITAEFPRERFEVYVIFAKLSAFAENEIAVAAALAQDQNVILLTDQELEPYYLYERAADGELRRNAHSLDALVQNTRKQYPSVGRRPFADRIAE